MDKRLLSKEWYKEELEASPIFVSLPIHATAGFLDAVKKQYRLGINHYEGGYIYWYTLVEDQDKIFTEILDSYVKDKRYCSSWFSEWRRRERKYSTLFSKIKNIDLAMLPDSDLFSLHEKFWNSALTTRKIDMFVDPFEFGAERRMEKILKKYCEMHRISFSDAYVSLSHARNQSFLSRYEQELRNISKKKYLKNIKDEKSVQISVKKLLDRYCWIKCNYLRFHPFGIKELKLDIKDLNSHRKNDGRKKTRLIKHRFTQEIKAISELSKKLTHLQDLRKINTLKFVFAEHKFLVEFAGRFNLDIWDLHLLDVSELKQVLRQRKILKKLIRNRKKPFIAFHTKNKIEYVYGNEVKPIIDKISGKQRTGIISGFCASRGIAKGKVKIICRLNEFKKFEAGDVLVTGMTRPEFLPLMRKASAVVTNDGGITSHAAIISRELGIPCIIGARNASTLLSDGDLVEVNANAGIVRKLK